MNFNYAEFSAAFPWFFPIAAFMIGACVGSFLNVCIYRIPVGKSVVFPGSHCGCGQPIAWYDNIPMFSWLLLRGRARCCGRPFSFRYPAIEFLTALLFLACWLLFSPGKAICGWVLLSALIAGTFTDLDHLEIPDVFTIGLGVTGVLLAFAIPSLHGESSGLYVLDSLRSGVKATAGLLIGSGLILWIALVAETLLKKEAMGFGDVKLVGAIGAFAGWQGAIFTLFGGAVIGTVWLALAWLWQKATGRASPVAPRAETPEGEATPLAFGAHVPFVPMLALAGALHFLYFHRITEKWFAAVQDLLG